MKKPKTYNLSKDVIQSINKLALADDRKDSDWLNRFLLANLPKKKESTEAAIKEVKFNFKKELLLLGVNSDVLDDWLIVRKNKKASNTKTALKAILTEVEKSGLTVADAIEVSASNAWSGFKSQWYFNLKKDSEPNKDILTLSNNANWEDGINDIF